MKTAGLAPSISWSPPACGGRLDDSVSMHYRHQISGNPLYILIFF